MQTFQHKSDKYLRNLRLSKLCIKNTFSLDIGEKDSLGRNGINRDDLF